MKKLFFILVLAVGVIAVAIVSSYLSVREEIEARQQAVDSAWSHVDAALQRRADLVPTLVASLRPISSRERAVFGELTRIHDSVQSARAPQERIAASQQLDAAVGHLLSVVDSDPDLRFNDKFFRLQEQLTIAGKRIAAERHAYDDAVNDYNAYISQFPNEAFARWSGHHPMANYFNSAANSQDRP